MGRDVHRYITIREIAGLWGIDPTKQECQNIRRRIRAVESERGIKIFLGKRPLVTTIPLLRKHMPECFDREDLLLRELKRYFESLSRRVKDLERDCKAQASKIRELGIRIRHLEDKWGSEGV